MRHDDASSTAQRVSRILDQARRAEPPVESAVWPEEWPPGAADTDSDERRKVDGIGFAAGPRWQVPVPAAIAAAVLALLVVGLAAILLLRGPSPGSAVPARAPIGGIPSGLTGASSAATEPAISGGTAGTAETGGSTGDPTATAGAATGAAGQLRVYVVGQVRHPGVVTLAVGARVEDAVQAVGGATEKADLAMMNLARKLVDGERIVVPKPGEKVPTADPVADPGGAGGGASAGAGDTGSGAVVPGSPVDLNTATVAQLDALPGVGPVIAGRIVAWRQENGRFTSVDDLSEVQGIGDATMARLRPLVRV